MPEGHTLHRLALDLTQAFGGLVVSVGGPQAPARTRRSPLDQTRMIEAMAHGKHTCSANSTGIVCCTSTSASSAASSSAPPDRRAAEVCGCGSRPSKSPPICAGAQLCTVQTPAESRFPARRTGSRSACADADPDLA